MKGVNMHFSVIKRSLIYITVVFFIISFSTNVFAEGSVTIKWGKETSDAQPKVNKKHKKNGPPTHAPAHGYRAKYQYRYYPNCSVYYDTSRKLYFYLKGNNWEVGASLPSNLRVVLGDFVSIEMDTNKPYVHYNEHVKKYPPGQLKQKKQKKWTKKNHKK
jgi:hypothetical protein